MDSISTIIYNTPEIEPGDEISAISMRTVQVARGFEYGLHTIERGRPEHLSR